MKKAIFTGMMPILSFGLGFAFHHFMAKHLEEKTELRKVTGIGGIFFKCKEPKKLRECYQKHLGLNTNQYGAVF